MGDFNIRVRGEAFIADLAVLEMQADKETLIGIRAVGKTLVRAEKHLAPVWKGKGVTRKQFKTGPLVVNRNAPIIGLLRASVKSGRARRDPDGWRIVVGPGGGRVNLYKGKIERKYGFARQAHDEVTPFAHVIMSAAWAKALRRGN